MDMPTCSVKVTARTSVQTGTMLRTTHRPPIVPRIWRMTILMLVAALQATTLESVPLPDKSPPPAGLRLSYSGSLKSSDPTVDDSSARSFRIHFLVTEQTASGGCNIAWVLEEGSG